MSAPQTTDRAGLWTRIAARSAAALVALVAGAASFEHIASVAIAAGERTWVAYALPAAIDGLIVVGVMALIEDRRLGRKPRGVARLAVVAGVAATLAANVASAEPTWMARLVALVAPVSFLLSVEVLTRTGQNLSTRDDANTADQPRSTSDTPVGEATSAGGNRRAGGATSPRRRPTAAQRVAKAVAETPDATSAEIAVRLHVSERTVQRYRPRPAADSGPTPVGSPDGTGPAGTPRVVDPGGNSVGNGGRVVPVAAGAFSRQGVA